MLIHMILIFLRLLYVNNDLKMLKLKRLKKNHLCYTFNIFSSVKTKTMLTTSIKLTVHKCYYPGPGNNLVGKVVDEVGKKVIPKCVGAGCGIPQPIREEAKNELPVKTPKVTNTTTTPQPTSNSNNNDNKKTKPNITGNFKSLKDQAQTYSTTVSTGNTTQHTQDKKEEEAIKKSLFEQALKPLKENINSKTEQQTFKIPDNNITLEKVNSQDNVNVPLEDKSKEGHHNNSNTKNTVHIGDKPPSNTNVNTHIVITQEEVTQYYKEIPNQYNDIQKENKTALNKEINALQKNNVDYNIKPSAVLKSISGKIYTTNINQNTTINDVIDEELKTELLKREIIKEDKGNTATIVKTEGNAETIIGNTKNGIKLTQAGQAYYLELKTKKQLNDGSMIPHVNLDANPNISFSIIVPPKVADDVFIEDGKQKHLLVVFDTTTNNYYSIGYMTSKPSGEFLSDKQYKYFENEQDHMANSLKQKQQFFVLGKHPVFISEDQIKIVKYSKEYLDSLGFEVYEKLLDAVENLKKIPPVAYNTLGITTSDGLDICKAYDLNESKKKKHPLTEDQKNLNNINKQKQKEGNTNIKKDKHKPNENEHII